LANADAIAHVGKTLVSLLGKGLLGLVPAGNVFLSTPENFKNSPPTPPAVTIFLYHVGICGEMRNSPRRANGSVQRPPLPLELRFLITPWTKGDDAANQAYLITGKILQFLYDRAVLQQGELDGDIWGLDDTVEIILESVPVEEHYDIWEPTGIPYRLSLTYLVRVIGIDSAVTMNVAPVALANFPKVAA
jgi:hypothetical protein